MAKPSEAQLRQWYEVEGLSTTDIGKRLGITQSNAARWCRKFGIKMRAWPCDDPKRSRIGKTHSEETKKKIGDFFRGKKLSNEHRAKVVKTLHLGARHAPIEGWNGNGVRQANGYFYIHMPRHPAAFKNGYVKLATLMVEWKCQKYVQPGEVVHHKNEDRSDDRPDNLEIIDEPEHLRRHRIKEAQERRASV